MPTNAGDNTRIPSITFSFINDVGQDTRAYAYSQGIIVIGILTGLCFCTILSSNFAVQLELEDIEPPSEIEFKLQMKSYRQIGDVWDEEHEKKMVNIMESMDPPKRKKKENEEEKKEEGAAEGG